MNMNKKDIIYKLAKGVYEKMSPASYGHARRKLIENQGVSEIALYGAVADHLEENDIPPEKYIDDMHELYNLGANNIFDLRNEDKFSFLSGRFSTISIDNSPESNGKFLCIKCYNVKNDNERSDKPNYKNCCQVCYKTNSREKSKQYAANKKLREAEKSNDDKKSVSVVEEQLIVEPPEVAPLMAELVQEKPYIEIETISGDSTSVIVGINCKTMDLSKFLLLIDPFVLPSEPKNKTPDEETTINEITNE